MDKGIINEYNVENISDKLMHEIADSLQKVKNYGSVEIYVQNGMVTQITTRNIKKTHTNNVRE